MYYLFYANWNLHYVYIPSYLPFLLPPPYKLASLYHPISRLLWRPLKGQGSLFNPITVLNVVCKSRSALIAHTTTKSVSSLFRSRKLWLAVEN